MLAAALVDPVHDGAHHLRMSNCHILLSSWNLPLGPGEASHINSRFCCHESQNYISDVKWVNVTNNQCTGSLPASPPLLLNPHRAGVAGHLHLAHCSCCLLGLGH